MTPLVSERAQPRETSSATTHLVLAWVEQQRGPEAVARVVADADIPETAEQLREASRWTSYDTRIRLFEAVVREFGDAQVMFELGASVVARSVTPSLILLLRALGSPAQVYRRSARAMPRFSTTSTMRVLEVGRASARVEQRLHAGYPHSRLDCLYAQGLLCSIPELFGLPRATLVHEACESDGAPACVYALSWPRWSRRAGARRAALGEGALRTQLASLQGAAADLAGSRSTDEALDLVVDRVAATVVARGYLLVVQVRDDDVPLVHSRGVGDAERDALVEALQAGRPLTQAALVVPVASARRHYGSLLALTGQALSAPTEDEGRQALSERGLLAAYAGHAAATLDLVVALEDAQVGQARAGGLLALSRGLVGATDAQAIARTVADALPGVVGSTEAACLLWDEALGVLRCGASVGLTPEREQWLSQVALVPQELPELVELLTERRPLVIDTVGAGPALQALLAALDVDHLLAVPLVAGEDHYGAVTVGWRDAQPPTGGVDELVERLQGVADQAATALQAAGLLTRVRHQVLHDALTRLPNRVLFADRLEQALLDARPGAGVGVLFCDLDRFKQVNDRHGHAAGDELLRQIALRLTAAAPDGHVVGRLSGDEFAVLLPDLAEPDDAERVARRLVACFDSPFRLEGRELRVTVSIGVASTTDPTSRADALLGAADGAMYGAKLRGRNQVDVAVPGRADEVAAPAALGLELREALREDQLRLVYQPVVRLPERRTVAVEALVRWQHPRLGLLTPGAFLPTAEESGLVAELDLWTLRTACRTLAAWGPDAPLRVAVNLASATLADPRLPAVVRAALVDHGLSPQRLELEVVESRALVDLPGVVGTLSSLRQLGVHIALDDFGTGFSTLSWLHRLPADRIKVDRSFIDGIAGDPHARALLRGVLALGRELGLEVVAEGVEDEEQLAVLEQEGCRLVQGYLLGRPAPAPAPVTTAVAPSDPVCANPCGPGSAGVTMLRCTCPPPPRSASSLPGSSSAAS